MSSPSLPRPERVEPYPLVDDVTVTGVTHDSRAVRPGDLYAALPGANTHGARFGAAAVAAGAVGILTDPAGRRILDEAGVTGVPVLVHDRPRARLGAIAAAIYRQPARDLTMIGVTGTNGKTTTTYLVEAALKAAGRTTGVIGTVETRIGEERVTSVRTTPESTDLHALLAVMRERGVTACVMEVSSHALVFGRVDGVVFDVAAFTNLSQDHLDFHGTLEDYFAAKADLFTPARSRAGVVMVDDEYGRRLADRAEIPVATVSARGEKADWMVAGGRLTGPDGVDVALRAPLPGDFNVANAALAVVTAIAAGGEPGPAAAAVAAAPGVPGRMELVAPPGGATGPLALVDYAHTPEAIATVLRALAPGGPSAGDSGGREGSSGGGSSDAAGRGAAGSDPGSSDTARGAGFGDVSGGSAARGGAGDGSGRGAATGRILVVVGAGGDRDRDKRPLMGAAAAEHADVVLVTDDNPRSEDPAAIRRAVLEGAEKADHRRAVDIREIDDRRAAIEAAVAAATGPGDVVVVLGKGHEQGQEIAGTVYPFDDREVLRDALAAAPQPGPDRAAPEAHG